VTASASRPAIALPEPRFDGWLPLGEALRGRRSARDFRPQPLTIGEAATLLWAAQGVTDPAGLRAAPSAGALYPLEAYLVAGEVSGLAPGVYRYRPSQHQLTLLAAGDARAALTAAAHAQDWIATSAAVLALAAVFRRASVKYGRRGERYAVLEAGHAAENVCLAVAAMGLGATVVGAFDDARVRALLRLAEDAEPLVLVPVGRV